MGLRKKDLKQIGLLPYLLNFKNCRDILAYTNDIDKDWKGIIIGSVFLTKDFIIPNGVGVDIGCGVLFRYIRWWESLYRIVYDASNDWNKLEKEELSIKDETNNINMKDNMCNQNDVVAKNCAINTSILNNKEKRNNIFNNNSVDKKMKY
ncbi:conserved protein, unknown function [Plasmodium gaboni]|uniref:3'-phosphate/5'-hydroxy nucleic acid ligase n=1 Tax=Plasmodium gaboni TaxID=647221 RepID=A0ABY1UV33_9APIC|nr:conserved protein, unknown function [Plasmodium gaboni]